MKQSAFRTIVIILELVTIIIVSLLVIYRHMFGSSSQFAPIVELKHGGRVQGMIIDADEPSQVFMYEAIPYGKAERFQKPVPHEGWSETWDATHPRDACPFLQLKISKKKYTTNNYSENCLYATVWVPATPEPNNLRPVMVYIHGGAFTFGTIFKKSHDGRYIAARGDVIVVGLNYRVGVFGFLYADEDYAPGNIGLWDQILALEWIKTNIKQFGGDPNRITAFGNSAGSQSIVILMHSPIQAKKLFHRAILQSGGTLIAHKKSESKINAQILAQNFSCPIDNSQVMLTCLRKQSIDDILTMTKILNLKFKPIYGDKIFPVLYGDAVKDKTTNFDIDIMFGVVEDEGTGFVLNHFPQLFPKDTNITLKEAIQGIPKMLNSFDIDNEFIINDTIRYYISDLSLDPNTCSLELRMLLSKIVADVVIDCPEILMMERWARHSQKKRYYSFRVTQAPLREANICMQKWMGVCHADELFYLFMIPEQVREIDRKLSQVMIRSWTLFARIGNPQHSSNVFWEEAFQRTSSNGSIKKFKTRFMKLEHPNYKMIKNFYKSCEQFWYSRLQY